MADIAQKYLNQYDRIVDNANYAYRAFQDNARRFHENKKFVYKSTITQEEAANIALLKRVPLEANVTEAHVSRLKGEFAKQEPAFEVSGDGANPQAVEMVENIFVDIVREADVNGFSAQIFDDQLTGGYSVAEVWTEYQNSRTFSQDIKIGRSYDPTAVFFDPLATKPHKGDGSYCFKRIPIGERSFKAKFPKVRLDSNSGSSSGLAFFEDGLDAYSPRGEKIIQLVEYLEKKEKKIRIVELSNGEVMPKTKAIALLTKLSDPLQNFGSISPVPTIVRERDADDVIICRYRLAGGKVIEYKETDFRYLPYIFFDGMSQMFRDGSTLTQFTRAYFHNAKHLQKAKNVALQVLYEQVNNITPARFLFPIEGFVEAFKDNILNPQLHRMIPFSCYDDKNRPVPVPTQLQQYPIPPEAFQLYASTNAEIQATLGAYDAALGINGNNISGDAIEAGSMNSNAASMPVVQKFLVSYAQLGEVILDLIPKYMIDRTQITTTDRQGKKQVWQVKAEDFKALQYDNGETLLKIKVQPGVNFEVQKQQAFDMLVKLMNASQTFRAFMETKGLPQLLDNISIRGADALKQAAEEFMQESQQKGNQPDPQTMALIQKIQMEQQNQQIRIAELQQRDQHKAMEMQLEREKMQNANLRAQLDLEREVRRDAVEEFKAATDHSMQRAELELKAVDQAHQHALDSMETLSKLTGEGGDNVQPSNAEGEKMKKAKGKKKKY